MAGRRKLGYFSLMMHFGFIYVNRTVDSNGTCQTIGFAIQYCNLEKMSYKEIKASNKHSITRHFLITFANNVSYYFCSQMAAASSELGEIVAKSWSKLDNWKKIANGVKVATILKGQNEFWSIIHMAENMTFPQHCHNNATEILHILWAKGDAKMGPCNQWVEDLKRDSAYAFLPSAPKVIEV